MLALQVSTLKEEFWEGHMCYLIKGIISSSLFLGDLALLDKVVEGRILARLFTVLFQLTLRRKILSYLSRTHLLYYSIFRWKSGLRGLYVLMLWSLQWMVSCPQGFFPIVWMQRAQFLFNSCLVYNSLVHNVKLIPLSCFPNFTLF